MGNLEEKEAYSISAEEDTEKGTNKNNDKAEKKQSLIRELLSWVMIFVGAFLFAFVVNHVFLINARIPSESMEKTIEVGDKVVGNRLAYLFSEPERGDIVIFWSPLEPDKRYIKRVIGVPGDTIAIEDNVLYINGKEQKETYLNNWTINVGRYYFDPDAKGIVQYNGTDEFDITKYKIPKGEYFMMGDNRDNSNDSRYWGTVKKDKIIAKVMFRWSPSFKKLK